jgi:hypothetical protein
LTNAVDFHGESVSELSISHSFAWPSHQLQLPDEQHCHT